MAQAPAAGFVVASAARDATQACVGGSVSTVRCADSLASGFVVRFELPLRLELISLVEHDEKLLVRIDP